MNKTFYEKLGLIIQEERQSRNLTQEQMAKKLKITRSKLANWESGRRTMNADEFFNFCLAFDIDVIEVVKKVDKYVN